MRVAFVHEWLTTYAGSERVLSEMLACYPGADLYCIVDFLEGHHRQAFEGVRVHTSFIQKLPFAKTRYRQYLPLMPFAVEQFDLSGYDVVISSNHAVAKGALTGPDQLHISYVHSPMRYAWDLQHQYLAQAGLQHGINGLVTRWLLHKMRSWDLRSSFRVDKFIANSRYVAARINKTYRRPATVIYPPIDVDRFRYKKEKRDFFLTVSRFVPYKRIDLIVNAFGKLPDQRLVVVGDGPGFEDIRKIAPRNVELLGYQEDDQVRDLLSTAKAFVFAAVEDFGIVMVEALASGTPVIALGKGGAKEIVRDIDSSDAPNGVLFYDQSVDGLVTAIRAFENNRNLITPEYCRASAMRFSGERFRGELTSFVSQAGDVARSSNTCE